MTNINKLIWHHISEDPSIQRNLALDLINIRALARYYIERYHLHHTSLDAVISAIRRYEGSEFAKDSKSIKEILKKAIITTKNYITCVTLNDATFAIIAKDFLTDQCLKENTRMIKGKERIKLFLNQKDLDKKLALFDKKDILQIEQNLGEIRVHVPMQATETRGVLGSISQHIALESVVIYEVVVAVPDLLFYVKQDELVKAHKGILDIQND